jgi:tRNA uridine 5-carboxymethylaminomethyl modification enzyme
LGMAGLRTEARQKLAVVRPRTLGQAGRIAGVTPADIGLLAVWVERSRKAGA